MCLSHAQVYSAFRLVKRAADAGARIVVVNLGETRAERSGLDLLKASLLRVVLSEARTTERRPPSLFAWSSREGPYDGRACTAPLKNDHRGLNLGFRIYIYFVSMVAGRSNVRHARDGDSLPLLCCLPYLRRKALFVWVFFCFRLCVAPTRAACRVCRLRQESAVSCRCSCDTLAPPSPLCKSCVATHTAWRNVSFSWYIARRRGVLG